MGNQDRSARIQIIVAVIGLIGAIVVALINNINNVKKVLHDPTIATPTPPSEVESRSTLIEGATNGEALAVWQGNRCLYPCTLLQVETEQSLVRFEFGQEGWVANNAVYAPSHDPPFELRHDADVYVKLDSGAWAPGQLKEERNGRRLVKLDPNGGCRGDQAYAWATADKILYR